MRNDQDEKDIIQEMILLREEEDYKKRGRDFEILVREFPLWSVKPPFRPASRKSYKDQVDSFYTWNSISFLIEAKAHKDPITVGSEKWKSHCNKLDSRKGLGVVGIFMSLNEVSDSLYIDARDMNVKGTHNFVLAGKFWDQLLKSNVRLRDVLEFMVQEVRVNLSAKPPKFKKIQDKILDSESIKEVLLDDSNYINSIFLRRYEHEKHDEIYVQRKLDKSIGNLISSSRPSLLRRKAEKEHYDSPKQLHIIRDHSGSGKTTISVELSRRDTICIPLCFSANQNDIDKELRDFTSKDSNSNILNSLIQIDLPLLVVIDSLDEVKNQAAKQKELKAIFKYLKELNQLAKKSKLSGYPIIIVFTVREEYYRDWESLLEGNINGTYKKRLSQYSEKELKSAIQKYSRAYKYNISNVAELDISTKEVLSIPVNLEIFSNANKFQRNVFIDEIWESKLLFQYFEEKKRQLEKRNLGIRHEVTFYPVLGSLALKILESESLSVTFEEFEKTTLKALPSYQFYLSKYWEAIISEDILISLNEQKSKVTFRYHRFTEFLFANHISEILKRPKGVETAKQIIEKSLKVKEVSVNRIIDNLEFCNKQFEINPDKIVLLRKALVSDVVFLNRQIMKERYKVSQGQPSNEKILKLAKLGASLEKNNEITFNTFFLVSSKSNFQSKETILEYFELAWSTNSEKRFKLIHKISQRHLILHERVIRKVFSSSSQIDWETGLGLIIENDKIGEFKPFLENLELETKVNIYHENSPDDWKQSKYLIDVCNGQCIFEPGLSNEDIDEFYKSDSTKTRDSIIIECLEDLRSIFEDTKYFQYLEEDSAVLTSAEKVIILKRLKTFLAPEGLETSPSLMHFILEFGNINFLLRLLEYKLIKVDKKFFETLLSGLISIDEYELKKVLLLAHSEISFDNVTALRLVQNNINESIDHQALEKLFCLFCFVRTKYSDSLQQLLSNYEIERIAKTILSIQNNKPIGFRFNNIISVVNNAVAHYKTALDYIMLSVEQFGLAEELIKKDSFKKKYLDWKKLFNGQVSNQFVAVDQIFPELKTQYQN